MADPAMSGAAKSPTLDTSAEAVPAPTPHSCVAVRARALLRTWAAMLSRTDTPSARPISPAVSWRVNAALKLLTAMRRSPQDWQIGELQTVARQHDIGWRHQKSSHCVFIREDGRTLSVPAHRPIKPIYVRKFVELVDGA